ncbi:glutamate racemase [Arcobacter peruensis]|uniref:glutamate racemase n=1 Tax=Arcobacter peruensis TaxID=2320140 RepID=UPI000F08CD26|nr:glutamate racemase [Arcobacter peruensis]
MKVGVFDSGLGGLTVVSSITEVFKGAKLFYVADTKYAPYGQKTQEQILKRSIDITEFLIKEHQISALIIACNTATSAAVKHLREKFPKLILVGTEPGIKPAIEATKTNNIGVLATPATLKGDKYQLLVNELFENKKVKLYEQACPGLVEQIEKGQTDSELTYSMLESWLKPMIEYNVDTIVLGCTHYPLIEKQIKNIMKYDITVIQTGLAIAKRLIDLSSKKGHINEGSLDITIYATDDINENMINKIFEKSEYKNKIIIRKCNI